MTSVWMPYRRSPPPARAITSVFLSNLSLSEDCSVNVLFEAAFPISFPSAFRVRNELLLRDVIEEKDFTDFTYALVSLYGFTTGEKLCKLEFPFSSHS